MDGWEPLKVLAQWCNLRKHCLGKATTAVMFKMGKNEGHLAESVEHATLDPGVPSSSPTLGVETT